MPTKNNISRIESDEVEGRAAGGERSEPVGRAERDAGGGLTCWLAVIGAVSAGRLAGRCDPRGWEAF